MRLLLLVLLLGCGSVIAEEIKVLSWNVESNRPNNQTNDPTTIAERLTEIQNGQGPYDLIALTEVAEPNAGTYESVIEVDGIDYEAYTTDSGGTDRMMLLFRKNRFTATSGPTELEDDGRSGGGVEFRGGSARRPTVVTLKDGSNQDLEFMFMVNHLTRGNASNRQEQARGLREWALQQDLPIVAAGDYNFDYDFRRLIGNQAMTIFMRLDGTQRVSGSVGGAFVWDWVIPSAEFTIDGDSDSTRKVNLSVPFVDTNWDSGSGNPTTDRFRDSILDFVFVAQGARDWEARSRVIVIDGDFPDDDMTSDHRPVEAIFDPEGGAIDIGGPRVKTN
ncbi:endonuclease/exonuclease/phosphatase family protein [Roseiconus lacunae]|uniref:endonuclease/exonuclease/phosphatase family protein n=1 Tax=Roseiconus lacunae TaxID=2605694 RepID=UPI0030926128|nr:endonuclease/exonuclease/phosphatase family protein [Stieleria sp. HD01]